jgi:hypothetical protein
MALHIIRLAADVGASAAALYLSAHLYVDHMRWANSAATTQAAYEHERRVGIGAALGVAALILLAIWLP